jgi:hypothetical protein
MTVSVPKFVVPAVRPFMVMPEKVMFPVVPAVLLVGRTLMPAQISREAFAPAVIEMEICDEVTETGVINCRQRGR